MTNPVPEQPRKMLELHFGALVPPLAKQLKDAKVKADKKDVERWQRAMDSITFLRIHGLLPDSASRAANKRLMKKISAKVTL